MSRLFRHLFLLQLTGLISLSASAKSSLKIDTAWVENNILHFHTSGEKGKFKYDIEQYRWKKWVRICSVWSNDSATLQHYSCRVNPHPGENRFRIRAHPDSASHKTVSRELRFENNTNSVKGKDHPLVIADGRLKIPNPANDYKIFDQFGVLRMQGRGEEANISELPRGGYFLQNGEQLLEFFKK